MFRCISGFGLRSGGCYWKREMVDLNRGKKKRIEEKKDKLI